MTTVLIMWVRIGASSTAQSSLVDPVWDSSIPRDVLFRVDNILFTSYSQVVSAEFLPRDVTHKRDLCRHAVSVCLSVHVSVTFVSCVKTNKDIFEIFPPPGSQAILVFPCQTEWRYSNGNPSNGGVECRWGRQKRDSGRVSGFAAYRSTVWSTIRVANCEK